MRIVVLGDFHMSRERLEVTSTAIQEINALNPDLVIPLGDYGPGKSIGSPEGLREAWECLSQIRAPLWPILGNHDLQEESGGTRTHGEMAAELRKYAPNGSGFGFIEYEDFRLLMVTTDPQPQDSCWQVQECYVSPQQWEQIQQGLQQRRGVPVIVCSHAPPVGAKLRTVPRTHVRSTNAWLDQNHEPHKWAELYREYPEILLWFSAHYHLGHDHHDSMSEVYGTFFFQCQIHGIQTRDGTRQSRVIDIDDNGEVTIRSLDHLTGQLTETSRWDSPANLWEMVARKKQILENPPSEASWFYVAEGAFLQKRVVALPDNRLLLATDDGYCWEVDVARQFVVGSLHVGDPLTGMAIQGKWVWRCWGNQVVRVDSEWMGRFARTPRMDSIPGQYMQVAEESRGIAASAKRVILLSALQLWEYEESQQRFAPCGRLPEPPLTGEVRLWGERVVYLSTKGTLWYESGGGNWSRIEERVQIWDVAGDSLAVGKDYGVTILQHAGNSWHTMEEYVIPMELDKALLICLDGNGWWLSAGRHLFRLSEGRCSSHFSFWDEPPSALLAASEQGRFHALYEKDPLGENRNGVWPDLDPGRQMVFSGPLSQ